MGNALGFGPIDFIEFGLTAILVMSILARAPVAAFARRLANRPIPCMIFLAAVPIVLRLALLARHPIPIPRVADDFSYLLLGDTLAHFRLANPMHPMRQFFEGVFVLQDPSWSSYYPLGQGFALAFGELVFRLPWAGVALSVGLLCALCYWMLKAWVDPVWALAGGLLAAALFGPLSMWMNTYWGGAVSGIAGCLVFGAIPRLRGPHPARSAILLGLGLGLQLLTRPYEFLLLGLAVLLFLVPVRSLAAAALVVLPALGLTLLQNRQVTGSWTTLPAQLSRYQYGIPTTFGFEAAPVPHRPLTVEQQIDYDAQTAVHNRAGYWRRLGERITLSGFFFLPPLYLAVPLFPMSFRDLRFLKVAIAIVIFWLGAAFYPYFYPHYIAAAACLFLLVSAKGLEWMSRFPHGRTAAFLILTLCLAHFALRYATAAIQTEGDPEHRAAIDSRLAREPGKQLVFVRYWPQHGASEWIHNAADIDGAKIVWAIDLGPEKNAKLRQYYPDRQAWLLEPDAQPPRLTALPPQP
ncbi:MAG TPA: hypothetical protein VKV17_08145 [Bryobacteraceae bacterium]|nr:hypothetical protein [Bryobacteraceae bacterium]